MYDVAKPGNKAIASIPVAKPAYLHGFGISQKYFVIAAGPLTVVPIQLLFWRKPYIENHHWRPEEGATIHVIEKASGKLKAKFITDPFFCFHHINAWDQGDELIMDLNAYDDASIIQKYYLNELENPDLELPFGTVRRFKMNLKNKKISCDIISGSCIELPRIDYKRYNTFSNYQFTYGVSLHPTQTKGFYNSLVKINTSSGSSYYWHEENCFPGEPFFQPSPNSKNDEDGILISIVLNAAEQQSFLLILDATNMQEIARASLPEPIVYGFHGEYFPD
jgi:carotenoid cleavage dioxygenase-like enzyme